MAFFFMNFSWGKCVFDFFIGCMSLSMGPEQWASIVIAIFFFAATIGLAVISICYRKEEGERVAQDLAKLPIPDHMKPKKKGAEFNENNMPPGGLP